MKKTLVVAGIGAAAAYLFGTEAGRAKLEQIKRKARAVASDPQVQQKVADMAGQVKDQAGKLADPVGPVVRTAAEQVQTRLHHDQVGPSEGSPGPAPAA